MIHELDYPNEQIHSIRQNLHALKHLKKMKNDVF